MKKIFQETKSKTLWEKMKSCVFVNKLKYKKIVWLKFYFKWYFKNVDNSKNKNLLQFARFVLKNVNRLIKNDFFVFSIIKSSKC